MQNVLGESAGGYLNALVSSVDEGLIRQLLTKEHCTSSKDEKEFVSSGVLWYSVSRLNSYATQQRKLCT